MTTINEINTTMPLPIGVGGTAGTTQLTASQGLQAQIGVNVQAHTASLDAVSTFAALSGTGMTTHTGVNTFADRTIVGTANQLLVVNGSGLLETFPFLLLDDSNFELLDGGIFYLLENQNSELDAGDPIISLAPIVASPNTLRGFDNSGNPNVTTAGSHVQIAGNTISASQAIFAGTLPQPNALQAADFALNPWQRGTTFTNNSGIVAVLADRWGVDLEFPGISIFFQKDVNAPSVLIQGAPSVTNSIKVISTAAAGTPGTDGYCLISHMMEGYQLASIAQTSTTLSFWVYSGVSGIFSVNISNAPSTGTSTYTASYTINAANTWEFKTINVPATPSSGGHFWNYGVGPSVQLSWFLSAGTNQQTPPGTWLNVNLIKAATGQANLFSSNANAFYLALPKWEAGNSYTGWYPETEQSVLAQCQRFYYKTFPQGVTPIQNAGLTGAVSWSQIAAAGASQQGAYITFPASILDPVIFGGSQTFYNPSAANAFVRNVTLGTNAINGAENYISTQGMSIRYTNVAGSAAGNINAVHFTIDSLIM